MSLSSESDFIEWADIRVDSLRMDNPRGQMESCVDFFVLFKENNEHGEPGVHISIPLDKAKELADGIYDHMPKLVIDTRSENIELLLDIKHEIQETEKIVDSNIAAYWWKEGIRDSVNVIQSRINILKAVQEEDKK